MQFINRLCKKKYSIILILFMAFTLRAESNYQLSSWLKTGALELAPPVFSSEKDIRGDSWTYKQALEFDHLDIAKLQPAPETPVNWSDSEENNWDIAMAGSAGTIRLNYRAKSPKVSYLVTYLEAERWLPATLQIDCPALCRVWLDDQEILVHNGQNSKTDTQSGEVKMEKGLHKITVKLINTNENTEQINFKASLNIADKYKNYITSYVEPFGYMDIEHLLYIPQVEDVSISAAGDMFAIEKKQVTTSQTEKWIEIRNYADGSLMHSFQGGLEIHDFKWSPRGNVFSYTTKDEDKSTIWQYDLENGKTQKILPDIKQMDEYTWTRDGENIIYSVKVKHPTEAKGVRRLRNLEDRQKINRFDHYLYLVNVKDGCQKRLTAGKLSTRIDALSPSGQHLIFSRHHIDYEKRPFSYDVHYLLNLDNLSTEKLFTTRWLTSIQWSPEGDKLLVTGGPSMFNGAGINLPADVIPNDYDIQAYIYSLDGGRVKPISKDFAPSIEKAMWLQRDRIIFLAQDRSHISLFEYDVDKNRFMTIDSYIEAIEDFDFAHRNSKNGLYFGTSANQPTQINKLKFGWRGKNELLLDPAQKYYKNVELSTVKRWTFNNAEGVEIEGRVYYPPEFDENKTYPCIVYYYGGTNPVSRRFDGRYPKNYWAANGYIVYVMQPSGATGFGQEFSAKHVNEWGSIVPGEIIDGVQKFLAAHPFVNSNKLGCIGASYGGFTTNELLTRTDIFAAAVSHAGISSIPGYWGEGYWGYLYSSIANAKRFPWGKTDFFIDNSGYFDAEKINTPLLLTHGTEDNNVPFGQSVQLYTALKLAGKQVELLECEDQGHWVLDPAQREKWTKSIVAWFDKWLKDQPEWWNDLYQ